MCVQWNRLHMHSRVWMRNEFASSSWIHRLFRGIVVEMSIWYVCMCPMCWEGDRGGDVCAIGGVITVWRRCTESDHGLSIPTYGLATVSLRGEARYCALAHLDLWSHS